MRRHWPTKQARRDMWVRTRGRFRKWSAKLSSAFQVGKEANMLVKYWMRKSVITVDAKDSMQEAGNRMKEYFVSLLPVLRDGKLVGIITDRDLKRAQASDATLLGMHELIYLISRIKCEDIMSKNPVTVPDDFTLEEAAERLLKNKISGAPVTDKAGRIVGTISQREIFKALISLTGLEKRGFSFAFDIEDSPGSIKKVTDVIREYEGRLLSVMTSYERARAGRRLLYVRAHSLDRGKMDEMLERLKEKSIPLYMVDHRDNERREFVESYRIG
jgi:acetoin utilization protein AcuB